MDLRATQEPLKAGYRADPESGQITLVARGGQGDEPIACSVDLGRAIRRPRRTRASAAPARAPARATCCWGARRMRADHLPDGRRGDGSRRARHPVTVEGDLDLRGTLGVDRDAPVGFTDIRLAFDIDAPGATEEQLDGLRRRTERYCVVMQTLTEPPPVTATWG